MSNQSGNQPAEKLAPIAGPSNGENMVTRTERGLVIRGTRKTIYSMLDYVHAGWPRQLIKDWMDLSEEEVSGAMAYIDSHRDEVEQEYQEVLRQAEEIRHYWEERNRDRPIPAEIVPDTPQRAALRAKLDAWKKERNIQ